MFYALVPKTIKKNKSRENKTFYGIKAFTNDNNVCKSLIAFCYINMMGLIVMEKSILILTTTNDFLEKFEKEDVKILQNMGYVVHYATNMKEPYYISYKQEIIDMGVIVHHIDIARSPFMVRTNYRALKQIIFIINKFKIQVIHCHNPVGGVLGRMAGRICRKNNIIVIYTAHGFHFYKGAPFINNTLYYEAEKFLARYTDFLIVVNHEDYINSKKFKLKTGGHIYRIPGVGIDMKTFRPVSHKSIMRKKLGIAENDFFIVSVGELNENKNQLIILEALYKMKKTKKGISGVKYGICGDGFLKNKIENKIQQYDLEDTVKLYGYCDNVTGILGCADVSVFPSKREGLGMAGLEALSMGIPLITSDNRGTWEYMREGENGFICHHNNADEFINAIQKIRYLSQSEKKIMSKHCRDSVKQFNKVYSIRKMEKIYSIVDKRVDEIKNENKVRSKCHYGSI